jgi:hypothetical protein
MTNSSRMPGRRMVVAAGLLGGPQSRHRVRLQAVSRSRRPHHRVMAYRAGASGVDVRGDPLTAGFVVAAL